VEELDEVVAETRDTDGDDGGLIGKEEVVEVCAGVVKTAKR
jgi:hypothetical protein